MPALPQPYSSKTIAAWISILEQSQISEERLQALQAIAFLAPPDESQKWAVLELQDVDPEARALAAKLIGTSKVAISETTGNELARLLDDVDPDARFEAARALIRRQSPLSRQAITVLLHLLDDEETQPLMVAAVLNAIVVVRPIEVIDLSELKLRVARLINHDRAEVREAVSEVIATWPDLCEALADQLLPMLDDSEPIVRERTAFAFGQAGIKDARILSALHVAASDEDAAVASTATEAILKLT